MEANDGEQRYNMQFIRFFKRRTYEAPDYVVLFFLFCTISIFKMPDVYFHGRLWGEEGTIFIPDLWHRSVLEAILYRYRGTVQVLNALALWVTSRSDRAIMPYVATYASVLIIFVLFAQLCRFASRNGVQIGVFAIFPVAWLLLPTSYEIWATSLNMQWLCSVSMVLLLIEPKQTSKGWRTAVLGWTVLCGLTGVPSCMLAPAFLWKAFRRRSAIDLHLGLVLTACSMLQLGLIVSDGVQERKLALLPLDIIKATITQTMIMPLFGIGITLRILAHPWLALPIYCLAFASMVLLAGLAWRRSKDVRLPCLAVLWLCVSCLNVVGSLEGAGVVASSPMASTRYFFFGSTCFCLTLVLLTTLSHGVVARSAAALLVLIATTGVIQRIHAQWPGYFIHGPSWHGQLEACRTSVPCEMSIWPESDGKWHVVLPAPAGTPR